MTKRKGDTVQQAELPMSGASTKKHNSIIAARLRELLKYDPATGEFIRVISVGNKIAGSVAGTVAANGYVYIGIDYTNYLAHRLAFLWMTGRWPKIHTDHKNGIRTDNRWSNLREVTRTQNASNVKLHQDNSSGYKGVYFHKASGLWHACIMKRGVKKSLGYFKTCREGHEAYVAESKIQHGKYARAK